MRFTTPVRRSTTATELSAPRGTSATPFRASTPTGVGVVPPSGMAVPELVALTGITLSVLAVLLTTSRSSVGAGRGAVVSAQAARPRARAARPPRGRMRISCRRSLR
jgi:hypothetical protein